MSVGRREREAGINQSNPGKDFIRSSGGKESSVFRVSVSRLGERAKEKVG